MQDFPIINNKKEFLEAIKNLPINYEINDNGWYETITYTFLSSELKNSKLLKECRGIAFNKDGDGKIISRPFHKFYNLNEISNISLDKISSKIVYCTKKYDGAMIRPIWFIENNKPDFVMATKHSHDTEIAKLANQFLPIRYKNFIRDIGSTLTPIFEFVSPHNKHVINYQETKYILLAIRNNISGQYVNYKKLQELSVKYNIELTELVEKPSDKTFEDYRNKSIGDKGLILELINGEKVKVKTKWYCDRHKIFSKNINNEQILKWFFNNELDDIIPFLKEFNYDGKVNKVINNLEFWIKNLIEEVNVFVSNNKSLKRKDLVNKLHREYKNDKFKKALVFAILDKKKTDKLIEKFVLNNSEKF